MPKSSKENSAVPRVKRSLRNRVVSVENETPDRIAPTTKKELTSILENDNKGEQSTTSIQTATPGRGRPRRSSQSEAISTPVKTPARRLTRRTSLSELDNATISSPLRRSTRKVSILAENIYVEESEEDEVKIIVEKETVRSSSKSPSAISNKIKPATENIVTKKGGSKEKKLRSSSPLNISKTIEEENYNEIDEIQTGGIDKKHNTSVLPTVREVMEETQQSHSSNEIVKKSEDEKSIIMEKRTTRSSSKSPNIISSENVDTAKRGFRLKKSRSPSPKNSDNTTQEKNEDEKVETQFSEDSGKNHNPTALPIVSEEVQQPQKSSTVDLVKESKNQEVIEKETTRTSLKSPSRLLKNNKTIPEAGEERKTRSKGRKSRSPSPFNTSAAKEDNENQLGESQSSGKADTNCSSTPLPTVREDPKEAEQLSQTFCKSPLPELPALNTTQNSDFSKLAVEIADSSSNNLPMKSPNPIEKEQEVVSPTFKRVTRSASKSPVVLLEKETRKQENLSKKIIKDSISAGSEDKQTIEEPQKNIKMSKEVKKGDLSAIEIKEAEITKPAIDVEPKDDKKVTEVAESKKISDADIEETEITKVDRQSETEEVSKGSGSIVLLTSSSTKFEALQKLEKSEKDKISLETNSELTKPTREAVNIEENEEVYHQSISMDFKDDSVIKADISVNEIIAKCSDDKKEEEKENRKPEKSLEVNILKTNLDKSFGHISNIEHVENKPNKSEESKIEEFEENNKDSFNTAEESIIDKSLDNSPAKDSSSIKHPQSESHKFEAPVIGEGYSKNETAIILGSSFSKSSDHLPNEESISSFSKSSEIVNINDETLDESTLEKIDLLKENESGAGKPIEKQPITKKQKSVVFDTIEDSEKVSTNYPKTPICSKSKSYVADEDPNTSVDTSIAEKFTSKRAISLDDSKEPEEECVIEVVEKEVNYVAKPDTPLKKIKAATILSSTPIINSKHQDVVASESSDSKKNTSLPLRGHRKLDDKDCFSKSWSQAIIGKAEDGENGAAFIDALEHEKKKERDAILLAKVKQSPKVIKLREAESSEDDDDEEDQEKNEFLDDEAMEVKEGEESMDSEERRYLEENEISEHGESIGSEDTDQDEADDCDEENSLDSFIASDADENHELLSVDSAEFSSDESTDEEKKVSKKRSGNTSRRIQSSDESDQCDEINVKTKKALKLMVDSSDEESKGYNEDLEAEREVRNEGKDMIKFKEQGKENITSQILDLDTSARQENEIVSSPCLKIENKQEMFKELNENPNNSIISVNSSCMEISIKQVTDNKQDKATTEEESAKVESKSNDNQNLPEELEQEISTISLKVMKRKSSLKTLSTSKELENLKENGGSGIRNLNSSEETLSATEKTIHSKSLHENDVDRTNTTNEDPILIKEVKEAKLSDKVLLQEPSDDANIKDRDEVSKSSQTQEAELKISVEPDIETLEDLHKTKKNKIRNLNKRVFSASFTAVETESTQIEKMSSSFTYISKKSKKINENKEKNQSMQEVLQEDDGEEEVLKENVTKKEIIQNNVLYGSSNLKEQSFLNNSCELQLDKIFTESDTSQHNEIPKGKKKDKKSKMPKRSKTVQKEEVEEMPLEESNEEDTEIIPNTLVHDYSTKQQWSSDAKETRGLSPMLQILNKSEARLETLIGIKHSINRKIKKMNMKLQQLYGNKSPKSNEILDEYERAIAVALKHGLSLLGKQKRKVSRKLQKMNYMPSENESSSEEAETKIEQKPQLKTKRKEKVVYTDNTELIPSQISENVSKSIPKKRKREYLKTLAETHEQSHAAYRQSLNFVKTTSGLFVEEPTSPEIQKTKKFRITSTLELPIGVVFEEAVTPTSKKVINGFQVTQATPRAIGFKVESILSAGQKEVPSVKKTGIKRKLNLSESREVLPKPKWLNSGKISVKKLQTGSSGYIPLNLNESASTHFMVAPLKSKKSRASSQAGPSTMKAMEFKARALSNKHIPRESSHNILQRKQKKKANQL